MLRYLSLNVELVNSITLEEAKDAIMLPTEFFSDSDPHAVAYVAAAAPNAWGYLADGTTVAEHVLAADEALGLRLAASIPSIVCTCRTCPFVGIY
jgi:hypothetical protein